ncbi:RHS repeat-associated core domain-containing protein [Clostridium sp.]|uniref:RHS repeat-associated core domain-containing protein n=1 Tax=Clostridium sp. TaxID=1506 RepID=UPI002FCB0B37
MSIEGTLKDSVGVKNPYRYRGYRYDTETGLYYLQSRYYNPEWGRFINADALIGQTGELLGHNMFAYTKNNPVNFKDDSGFVSSHVSYDIGEGTYESKSNSHNLIDKITKLLGTDKGNVLSGIADSGIAQTLDKIVSKITKPIDYLFSTPKIATFSNITGKIGILNAISFGSNVRDNVLHYNTWDAAGRTVVDGVGFVATIAFGAWTAPFWAPTLAGFTVGTSISLGAGIFVNKVSGWVKDTFFEGQKYN